MGDVRELVRRQHLTPGAKSPDIFTWVGRSRPEVDDRSVEQRPRRSVRCHIRVVDDDVRSPRWPIANDARYRRVDGLDALSDVPRPRLELHWIIERETRCLDRPPGKPRAHAELCAGIGGT